MMCDTLPMFSGTRPTQPFIPLGVGKLVVIHGLRRWRPLTRHSKG